MQMQRKKEIYDICVKFGASNLIIRLKFSQGTLKKSDIIIVEDDPYYFLQEGPYVLSYRRTSALEGSEPSDEEYLRSLAPSFLAWCLYPQAPFPFLILIRRFDHQGRVVRLDTFSKVGAGSGSGAENSYSGFSLDHCPWKSSGMVHMQSTFCRKTRETVRNVDTSTLRIWPGELHSMTNVDFHWHRLLLK